MHDLTRFRDPLNRRGLLRLGLLASAGLALPALAALPEMQAQEAASGCWYVQGLSEMGSGENQNFISNAGFIVTSTSVVVVDALGSPALAERLVAQIRKLTPKPISHVVLTHYHADHIYGLQVFKALGARIVAQQQGREYLFSDTARLRLQASRTELAPWINEDTRLVAADQWIDAPTSLSVGDTKIEIIPVGPAHTPDDLVVWLPARKVLYSGDLVFRGRIPYVGEADSGHWIKALDELLKLGAQVVIPGHGAISHDARKDMQFTRDYLAYLRKAMGQAAEDMTPFDEAYQATDWSQYEHMPLFGAANRMNAYNTYILMEREAQ
ncbi:MBL fold metallo-hydrolase [Comamonas sp. NLF-1-9]|uniref:MBL fold metallo-hydrolase n=1 Tax=Comamonas sp. NLF-1-9 TaxID=2853163 RepID=UPI00210757A8|nr:MBL fold metallo-hydrolase [Comamonas sp. NLF-1-9]